MTHTYKINGMTCNHCVETVKETLENTEGVEKADVTLEPPQAIIRMRYHLPLNDLQKKLSEAGDYYIEETGEMDHQMETGGNDDTGKRTFFVTYKPLMIVFGYLAGITIFSAISPGNADIMGSMSVFMGGFFLVFSFFKMLDLKGFAYSYMTYDIIAKKWAPWGYIYAFIELALGVSYIFHFQPVLTAAVTLVVMTVSSIGVIQSLVQKRKIQCACLGTVFNLPMSNITLIEDLLMVTMAAVMLVI